MYTTQDSHQSTREEAPQPWDPFRWMAAMWLALFALVFAATQGLPTVLLYLAVLTPLVAWRIRQELGLRRGSG